MEALQLPLVKTPIIREWLVLLATAGVLSLPVAAQEAPDSKIGLPQDWSGRHLIYSNPETREDAEKAGKLDKWIRKANDPRFVAATERREKSKESKRVAALDAAATDNSTTEITDALVARQKRKKPRPVAPGTEIHRDWSNVMGGVGGVGDSRTFPAKFAFGIDAKDCASDFVVFTTSAGGASSSTTASHFYSQTASFSNPPTAGQTLLITNTTYTPDQVLTLTADASVNTGLKFAVGANATEAATNLANAIARNGGTVGVTATSSGTGLTIRSITANVTTGQINYTNGLSNLSLVTETSGSGGTKGQPTIFALNQLYADSQNGGCQTSATQAVPAVYWSYNTGDTTLVELSPVLSFYDNGAQVAFIQRSGTAASLVLLKWSSSSPGTLGAPTIPNTASSAANYRSGCAVPCMIKFALSAADSYSAPYVDYTNDILYVGDNTGKLHKFTGVFAGTPGEAGSPWPVQVAGTSSLLSSPVYDSVSDLVFVGSSGPNAATGNKLHSVSSAGTVVSSGTIGSSSDANGVVDAPIVDSTTQKVYAFQGADATGGTDALGTSCGGAACNSVYQFATTFTAGNTGSRVFVGQSGNQGDLHRAMSAGQFDDAYYSSSGASGFLYVCGSAPADARRPTLYKIGITSNTFASSTRGPLLVSGDTSDGGCSPVTVFENGSTEHLYASVNANAAALGGNGCTQTAGCAYMYHLPTAASFDTTSTSSAINGTNFASVSTSTGLNATETVVETTLTAAQAGTYYGMTITQGANNGNATTRTYTLRKNGASTAITCTVALSQDTCFDNTNSATFAAGDTIAVQAVRSGAQNLSTTLQIQLGWNTGLVANAALNATGGTGGIVIDNTVSGGGSQVYYSTRTNPGIAVQATQAGLQ